MDTQSNEEWKAELDEIVATFEAREAENPGNANKTSDISPKDLARYFDHTVLKLDATEGDVDKLCSEAKENGFAAVCVRKKFVARAKQDLVGMPISIACVVGFHEGVQCTPCKLMEAQKAIEFGATELDVVLNRDVLQAGDYAATYAELFSLREVAPRASGVHLKLILETSMLSKREIIYACALAGWAGWDYVKTSTGFCGHGATVEHVRIMRTMTEVMAQHIEAKNRIDSRVFKMKVKASGGIRTYIDAVSMIEAGADRIGASAGVAIMEESTKSQSS